MKLNRQLRMSHNPQLMEQVRSQQSSLFMNKTYSTKISHELYGQLTWQIEEQLYQLGIDDMFDYTGRRK